MLSAASSNGYRLPQALEVATGILTHYVRTGDRLLGGSNGITYPPHTRCQELIPDEQLFLPVAVGVLVHFGDFVGQCWKDPATKLGRYDGYEKHEEHENELPLKVKRPKKLACEGP